MSDIMADDLWVGGSDPMSNANWHRMMNFEARPNAVIAGALDRCLFRCEAMQ